MNSIAQKTQIKRYRWFRILLAIGLLFILWFRPGYTLSQEWATSGTNIYNTNSGYVGIGTVSPSVKLEVKQYGVSDGFRLSSSAYSDRFLNMYSNSLQIIESTNDLLLKTGSVNNLDFLIGQSTMMRINPSGNVGIGTTNPSVRLDVLGDATFSGTVTGGNIQAKYQDIAEWVYSPISVVSGTVVVLDVQDINRVIPSSLSYDTRVAGVVTDTPGILLGESGEGKIKVATTGRVKVKVDATKGPIEIGNLLVTSEKEGYAMRSEPVDVGGIPIHRPGTLIGKALEPLKDGQGEILVLLSLQ